MCIEKRQKPFTWIVGLNAKMCDSFIGLPNWVVGRSRFVCAQNGDLRTNGEASSEVGFNKSLLWLQRQLAFNTSRWQYEWPTAERQHFSKPNTAHSRHLFDAAIWESINFKRNTIIPYFFTKMIISGRHLWTEWQIKLIG